MTEPTAEAPPAVNRSARLAATVMSGWVRTAATVAIGLICTPILVRLLGRERFGVVRMAEQWFAYLEFLSFGLGGAVGVLLLRAATRGGPAEVSATARSGFRLLARQLRWIVPGAALMAAVFPFVFDIAPELRAEFYWAVPAVLCGVCLTPFGAFRSVLEAQQRGYLVQLALVLQAVVIAGTGIVLASVGFGLTGQLWAILFGAIGFHTATAAFAGVGRDFRTAPAVAVPDVWRLQWPLLVAGIGNQINILSDNLLAGAVFGLAEVAALVLTQRLFQLATVVGSAVNGTGTWAGLVDLRAKSGHFAFGERVAEVSKLNVGVQLLVLAPVLGYNARFIDLWVGRDLYAGDAVTAAIFAQLTVFNFLCLFSALVDLFGETRKRVWVSTAGTGLKLISLVPLTRWLGLAGLPLATTLGYLCTDAWYCPRLLSREHGVPMRWLLFGLLRAVAVGGGWAVACYLIGNRPEPLPGWTGLAAEVLALELAGIVLGWTLLLNAADRAVWRARVRTWLARTGSRAPVESAEATV